MACNLTRLSYYEALDLLPLKTMEEEYPKGYEENYMALFNLYIKKNMLRYFVRRGEFEDCKCCKYWKEFLKLLPISVRKNNFVPQRCYLFFDIVLNFFFFKFFAFQDTDHNLNDKIITQLWLEEICKDDNIEENKKLLTEIGLSSAYAEIIHNLSEAKCSRDIIISYVNPLIPSTEEGAESELLKLHGTLEFFEVTKKRDAQANFYRLRSKRY